MTKRVAGSPVSIFRHENDMGALLIYTFLGMHWKNLILEQCIMIVGNKRSATDTFDGEII